MERARGRSVQEVSLVLIALASVGLACAVGLDRDGQASEPRTLRGSPGAPGSAPSWKGTYLVRAGDTLAEVARCRGISVAALASANGIRDPDRIEAGRRLVVPQLDRCATPSGAEGTSLGANGEPLQPAAAEASDRGRRLLEQGFDHYDSADFEQALALAESAAAVLTPYAGEGEIDRLRAKAHYLAALASLGLERRESAQASLRRALALDPDLAHEQEGQSPRMTELVRETTSQPAP
jgi:LysM repeat protein